MKKLLLILLILPVPVSIFFSCQKEYSCEGGNPINNPPVANAGRDTSISLPADSIILNGSASSDPDNNITEYKWTKISGPTSFTITNDTAVQTTVSGLIKGMYEFELIVTDAGGLSDKDTVIINVNDITHHNKPPVANAGSDQTIILPSTSVNLDGSSSSDPENNIISYSWSKISGPSSFEIIYTNSVKTGVINLVEGVYQFELIVTDAEGLFDKDTVQIEVKQAVQQNRGNVCFYVHGKDSSYIYITYDDPKFSVTINGQSGTISGIWGKNDSISCPLTSNVSYYIEPGINCVFFNLPTGTYDWSIEGFQNFGFKKITGTMIVNQGDSCIIQKIDFP